MYADPNGYDTKIYVLFSITYTRTSINRVMLITPMRAHFNIDEILLIREVLKVNQKS